MIRPIITLTFSTAIEDMITSSTFLGTFIKFATVHAFTQIIYKSIVHLKYNIDK